MNLNKRIILLDRDGVINQDSDAFVKSSDEWIPIPGSLKAISLLNKNGFTVFVITNQSGIGRGYFSIETLNAMHLKMSHLLKLQGGHIEQVYYCPHTAQDNCECRKPKPGLLQRLMIEHSVNLEGVPFVGDSLRDLEAGLAVKCYPILVKTGKGEKTIKSNPSIQPEIIYENLLTFAESVLEKT